jgi:N-acetylated-alpha-linked acidic dipeptidase
MTCKLRRSLVVCALAGLLLAAPAPTPLGADEPGADAEPLLGFTPAAAEEQRELEARFDELIRVENLETWLERMAARPHPVGSPWGKENADFMVELFRSWGYDARLEEFQVLFPTPKVRRVEMIEPTSFVAGLEEPTLEEDSTSGQKDEQLPLYNAYSIDGDVTGELVYVNYGRPEDYDALRERGVSVEGKIAIARYGGAWRGIKPKVAAEHGAIGCIIYSDPRDDGFFIGDVYPEGGYRPATGGQRGSVADKGSWRSCTFRSITGPTR